MADSKLISKIPEGPLKEKWSKRKAEIRIVSPNNKRKLEVIVVGTGLGGASAAASLGEMGYNVKIFCISDSPRRAHSIAAQGGINAAKNYRTTTTPSTVCSTTPSRVVTTVPVKPTSIVWPRSALPSSTSVSPRAFRLPVNTADTWPTVPSAVCR